VKIEIEVKLQLVDAQQAGNEKNSISFSKKSVKIQLEVKVLRLTFTFIFIFTSSFDCNLVEP
jgi:hypothetical protein